MTFLNPVMLLALAAVGAPILIHLLNRRRPQTLQWGAMRFLRNSLAARRKRILLEEILLMALRCMLVALLALAAARPFLPAGSRLPWVAVLPALLAASVCVGVGVVMWRRNWAAYVLLGLGCVFLAAAVAVAVAEYRFQRSRWLSGAEAQDVAIVVDGSMSMTLQRRGRTNFQRAVDQAREVVDSCSQGDAVSIILAGPVPTAISAGPISDREEVRSELAALRPTNGAMDLPDALNLAAAALAEGQNAAKHIVLVTDGQSVGWDLHNKARWRFLASSLEQLGRPSRIICRTLELPESWENASLARIGTSRRIVGTDRPVKLTLTVANTGTTPGRGLAAEAAVDGRRVGRRHLGKLPAGARETVQIEHRFRQPGPHVVSARLVVADDLPADNEISRVVNVIRTLPVLILTGSPSSNAAPFLATALAPGGGESSDRELMDPNTASVADRGWTEELENYRVVILYDVPRLPAEARRALQRFVRGGGGLLIAPGRKASPQFYNEWTLGEGRRVAPGLLMERVQAGDAPVGLALESCTHPALALFAEPDRSDAGSALIHARWRMETPPGHGQVRVGGRLNTGEPFLLERRLGRGYVAMTALSLGRRDSNLPSLNCFVPLAHELVQHLAAPMMPDHNVAPGAQVAVPLPGATEEAKAWTSAAAVVLTPSGGRRSAGVRNDPDGRRLTFAGTTEPGLYRFLPDRDPEAGNTDAPSIPFAVTARPEESSLTPLGEEDFAAARAYVRLDRARNAPEMISMVTGEIPGREIWRRLVLCALVVLLLEVALSRWISLTRGADGAEAGFGTETVDYEALRAELLGAGTPSELKREGGSAP